MARPGRHFVYESGSESGTLKALESYYCRGDIGLEILSVTQIATAAVTVPPSPGQLTRGQPAGPRRSGASGRARALRPAEPVGESVQERAYHFEKRSGRARAFLRLEKLATEHLTVVWTLGPAAHPREAGAAPPIGRRR